MTIGALPKFFCSGRESTKMPHYEVIAIIHPDQHARTGEMAGRYQKIIKDGGGKVHRFEDWGLRDLAYPMKKQRRAQYILLNVECGAQTLGELQENFRFSDAVMRSMVVRCDEAISEQSPMMKKIKEEKLAEQAEAESKALAESKIAAENKAKSESETATAESKAKPAENAKPAKVAEDTKDAKPPKKPARKGCRAPKPRLARDNENVGDLLVRLQQMGDVAESLR